MYVVQQLLVIILFVSFANGEDSIFIQSQSNKHDNDDEATTKKQTKPLLVADQHQHQHHPSSPSCSSSAVMIVYDDKEEAEIRRRLLEKAPPNRYQIHLPPYYVRNQTPMDFYKSKFRDNVRFDLTPRIHPDFDRVDSEIQEWWKRYKESKELSYEETLVHTEPLRNSYQEMLTIFNNEVKQWDDKVDQELQRRWDEELSQDEQQMYSKELQSQQNAWQDYEQTKEQFQKELQTIIARNVRKNQIANPIQPQTRRYPDHEFAIEESYIVFHWSLANSFLMILESSNSAVVPKALIAESNIPGKIPVFVDSSWQHGLDFLDCPKKRKAFEEMPKEEKERQWVETAYYKVYPPDDVYVEEDGDGFSETYASWGHSLRFNRTSVRRFLQLTWEDIQQGQQWTSAAEFSEAVFTPDSNTGQLHAKVIAFRSQQGDRIELWEEKQEHDAYAILQTHRGRVVVISVSGGHAYLLCNLLEFYNSDGSMDMPHFLSSDLDDPKRFARKILKTAESFLYDQTN